MQGKVVEKSRKEKKGERGREEKEKGQDRRKTYIQ